MIIDENQKLRSDNSSLTSQLDSIEGDLRESINKLERAQADLAASEDARRNLKFNNDTLNSKLITIEEQLFQANQIQLELIQ